jgi:phosphopantetheinyl transferase
MQLNVFCQNVKDTWYQNKKGNLDIFFGNADIFLNGITYFYNCLSDSEKTITNRFKFDTDYNCYTSAHALLRIEISKLLKVEARSIVFDKSTNGKPIMTGFDLPFSLSRNRNYFAFTIGRSNQYLGIDIEQIRVVDDIKAISCNYYSFKEQQLILNHETIADQSRTFLEFWTRKEALLKAVGIGINTNLRNVQVLEGENLIDLEELQINSDSFKIMTIMINHVLISIASSYDFVPNFKFCNNELSLIS